MSHNGPTRYERKRLQMLNHLASVARRLFEREGFDTVTMEQIAAEADVAKGTLYKHFPTKEAVLAYAIHEELGRDLGPLMQQLPSDAGFPTGVEPVMDALAQWCEAHRDYLAPYLRFRFMDIPASAPATDASSSDDIVDVYSFLIGNSQRANEFRQDLEAAHLAVLFHHLCLGVLLRWLVEKDLTLRQELSVAVELFLNGAVLSPATAQRRGRKA